MPIIYGIKTKNEKGEQLHRKKGKYGYEEAAMVDYLTYNTNKKRGETGIIENHRLFPVNAYGKLTSSVWGAEKVSEKGDEEAKNEAIDKMEKKIEERKKKQSEYNKTRREKKFKEAEKNIKGQFTKRMMISAKKNTKGKLANYNGKARELMREEIYGREQPMQDIVEEDVIKRTIF